MSALPPKADIAERDWNVRFVPKQTWRKYSITSSVSSRNDSEMVSPSA